MSNLLTAKINMETFIQTNWNDFTPIHWAGEKWNATDYTEWIYVEYYPYSLTSNGITCDEPDQQEGELYFICVGATRFRAMQIADKVVDMMYNQTIKGGFIIKSARVMEQGAYDETPHNFVSLIFETGTR